MNVGQGRIPVHTIKCIFNIYEEYRIIVISLERLAEAVNCVFNAAFLTEAHLMISTKSDEIRFQASIYRSANDPFMTSPISKGLMPGFLSIAMSLQALNVGK